MKLYILRFHNGHPKVYLFVYLHIPFIYQTIFLGIWIHELYPEAQAEALGFLCPDAANSFKGQKYTGI